MRRGPKPRLPMTSRSLSKLLATLPKSGGQRAISFIQSYIKVPRGSGVKKLMRLLPFEQKIISELFESPRPKLALVSIARANGKTTLCAAIALYALLADREESAEILIVAKDQNQSRIAFNLARRMLELQPRLLGFVQIFADRLYVPSTDSTLMALPADPGALLGHNPSLMLIDELSVVDERVWDSVVTAAGKRKASLTLAITTPCESQDSVLYRLREQALEGDPSFFYLEFSAPPGCRVDDEWAWAQANPALDHYLDRAGIRSNLPPTVRESVFRRQRLGQYVFGSEEWVSNAAWSACGAPGKAIGDGMPVVLGLDAAYIAGCTALVAVSVEPRPHVELLQVWENDRKDPEWVTPILDVERRIRAARQQYEVRALVASATRWARTLELLKSEGLAVVAYSFATNPMVRATVKFQEAVLNRQLTHAADPVLAHHVQSCSLRSDAHGPRIVRSHRDAPIDAAIAAVIAFDQATAESVKPPEPVSPIPLVDIGPSIRGSVGVW